MSRIAKRERKRERESPFVSLLLRALRVVQPDPGRVPGLVILQAGGWMVHLEVDDNFSFSLQVVFQYSRLRALRSMCAAGWRSHTFTRCLHVQLFTLARVLSCSLEVMVLMCFLREAGFPAIFLCPSSTGIHTGVPDGSSVVARPGYRTSHPTSTRCPRADGTSFPRDSCEDTDEEEDHCTDGQITNSTAVANTPGLRAEERWPWHRSLVVFLAGRRVA